MGSFTQVRIALSYLTKRELVVYLLLIGLRTLAGLLDLLGILLIALVVNLFTTSGSSNGALTALPDFATGLITRISQDEMVAAFYLGSFALLLFVLKGVFSAGLSLKSARQIAWIESQHSSLWQEQILRSQLLRQSRYQPSEVAHLLTFGCSALFSRTLVPFSAAVADSLVLIATLIALLIYQPTVTIFAVLYFLIIGILLYKVIGKRIEAFGNEHLSAQLESTQVLTDWLGIQRELHLTGRFDTASSKFRVQRRKSSLSLANTLFMAGLPRYVVETALILGAFLLAWYEFSKSDSANAATTLALFLASGTRITPSLLALLNANSSIRQSSAEASKTLSLLKVVGEKTHSTNPMKKFSDSSENALAKDQGLEVRLEDVCFSYGLNPTISNVTVTFDAGKFSAIIGPSGSGKSTLADLILGVLTPDSGKVLIQGVAASDYVRQNPGSVAYVPQDPKIISGTFAENIAFALRSNEIDPEKVLEACAGAQLLDLVSELPEGIHTLMTGRSVSGGQLQRIGIARALFSNSKLLVMDEPTSALDADTEKSISLVLEGLKNHVSVIVIAHRFATVQNASRIAVIENGKLTDSGRFEDLLRDSPLVERQAKLMQLITRDDASE